MQLALRVDPMYVIDDLVIRLWVKSNRADSRLGVRITLPRTTDPKTGERVSVVVLGDKITEVNRWTQLKLEGIATLLDSQLPTVRKSQKRKIDPAEAFVDLIIVEESSGPGEIQVCVDGLVIDGVALAADQPKRSRPELSSVKRKTDAKNGVAPATFNPLAAHHIKANGGIFEIDDRATFIRSIEHSGESFEFLKSLGFNAIELRQPPTIQQDQEATRLKLWLIAPPVFDPRITQKQQEFSSVIAWTLGDGVREAELEPARKYVAEYRSRSSDATQAFVASADSHLWEWSRLVDLLIADPGSALGSGELAGNAQKLQSLRARGRPGAPSWAVIHTEPNAALVTQWRSYLPDGVERVCLSPDHLRLQAIHAILGGTRGLVFKSRSRLDGKSPAEELRAAALKWLNLQLDLIAPWASTGEATVLSKPKSDTLIGTLTSDRATLLIMANQSPEAQFESSGAFAKSTTAALSGNYERTPRFQLTWRVIRQLSASANRDSSKITVERTGSIDYVIFAEDATALQYAVELTERRRNELAICQIQVASLWLRQTQASLLLMQEPVAGTEAKLTQAGKDLTKNDDYQALRNSEDAMRMIAAVRYSAWKKMVGALPSPLVSPLCVSAELLPAHTELSQRMIDQTWSPNRLLGGDLESIESLQNASWLAYQTRDATYGTTITNCTRAPQSGNGAISLITTADQSDVTSDQTTAAITSPGITVRRGDLVRYRIWYRGGEERSTSESHFQLFDNLAGRELAVDVDTKPDWTPLVLYRFAPADGEATLTIALQGVGQVDLDSIEIQTLSQANISPPTSASK